MLTEKEKTRMVTAQEIEHFLNKQYKKLLTILEETSNDFLSHEKVEIERMKGVIIGLEELYEYLFGGDDE